MTTFSADIEFRRHHHQVVSFSPRISSLPFRDGIFFSLVSLRAFACSHMRAQCAQDAVYAARARTRRLRHLRMSLHRYCLIAADAISRHANMLRRRCRRLSRLPLRQYVTSIDASEPLMPRRQRYMLSIRRRHVAATTPVSPMFIGDRITARRDRPRLSLIAPPLIRADVDSDFPSPPLRQSRHR